MGECGSDEREERWSRGPRARASVPQDAVRRASEEGIWLDSQRWLPMGSALEVNGCGLVIAPPTIRLVRQGSGCYSLLEAGPGLGYSTPATLLETGLLRSGETSSSQTSRSSASSCQQSTR